MLQFLAFALITSLGLLIQAVVGFAGSLLAIPLLTLWMSPREAVPAYAFVILTANVLLVLETRRHVAWHSVRRLLLGGLTGVPLGALALKTLPVGIVGVVISAVTLVFGILFLARVRVRFPEHPVTEPLVGLISGMLSGSVAQAGPPVVIYGISRQWNKDVFRSSLLTYFLCLSATSSFSYLLLGIVTGRTVLLAASALLPGLAAVRLGVLVKRRIDEGTFRRIVLGIIVTVGLVGLLKHLIH
jgi:uncharacterized protein